MGFLGFMAIITLIAVLICFINDSTMTPDERKKLRDDIEENKWGPISPAYICPQTKGFVYTKPVKRKKGVSGAKLTGAVLTMGVSMLATGLSRKEGLTQAHCENCGSSWDFRGKRGDVICL
jgi:hypothetical protein